VNEKSGMGLVLLVEDSSLSGDDFFFTPQQTMTEISNVVFTPQQTMTEISKAMWSEKPKTR